MIVYVVEEGQYSDRDLIAVLSTFELAKAAVQQHIEQRITLLKKDHPERTGYPYVDKWEWYPVNKYRSRQYWGWDGTGWSYTIHELALDEMPIALDW